MLLNLVWLVPVLPIIAFVLIFATAKWLQEKAAWFGLIAVFAGLIISVGALAQGGEWAGVSWQWVHSGGIDIRLGLTLDRLGAITLLVVTLVSAMVHIYSLAYMKGDKRFTRYYGVLSLFTAGMLLLALSDNFFILLVAWELMGLCSYLLIGHWYENEWPQYGSMKAFLTTRIGDVGMMFGIWQLFQYVPSFRFTDIFAAAESGAIPENVLLLATLLLFAGAVGKSAQFPLHVWLPDAMAGPTPASSLIHAATMVAAGVFLVARTFPLFALAPAIVLVVVALIGGITCFMAATIATVRTDIKEVLAYSTISQLGYMVLALGTGNPGAAVFHLVTHAFFKALLFQAAGSVIHAADTQEMHQMGGLRKKLPITFWTWTIGTAALAGVPFFSGFYSKDEILLGAYNFDALFLSQHGLPGWIGTLLFALGLATAVLTAYYMTRATVLTFFGEPRNQEVYERAHESPWQMTVPLMVLSVPSLVAGWGLFGLSGYVKVPYALEQAHPAIVPILATTAAIGGIAVGFLLYGTRLVNRAALIRAGKPLYLLLKHRYFFDELYERTVIALSLLVSRFIAWFDAVIVDGIVNLFGTVSESVAFLIAEIDRRFVDGIVNFAGLFTLWVGRQLRRLQTGLAQTYMLAMAAMVVIGIILFQLIGG